MSLTPAAFRSTVISQAALEDQGLSRSQTDAIYVSSMSIGTET